MAQGRESAKQYLEENPVVLDEIEYEVRKHYGLPAEKKVEQEK